MRVITRGTLKISRAICAAMMFRLSPLVREAKPSADSIPAWRRTSSSIPLPSTISPAKSSPSRSNARRLLSMTVTRWPDLGLGGRDVVGHSPKAHRRPAQVDDGEGRVGVAIARLPDAARVDQRRRRHLDPVGPFGDLLAALGEDPRQVGVSKEAKSGAQANEDFEGLKLVEDVFPDVWLARTAMDKPVAANAAVERQRVEVTQALRCHDVQGPAGGGRGVRVEQLQQAGFQHRLVVIAANGSRLHRLQAVDDGEWVRAIADDVAQHQDAVDLR